MYRMGHASPQAALRYQHATRERDQFIADAFVTIVAAAHPDQRIARAPGARPYPVKGAHRPDDLAGFDRDAICAQQRGLLASIGRK
jgi:hypothetical protein